MIEKFARWRKKYTLTLLMWLAGTVLAFYTGATLGEYTVFCSAISVLFKAADLADKGKLGIPAKGNSE